MKKAMITFIIFGVLAVASFGQTFTYVGAAKCAICHKTEKQGQQFVIWDKSAHSKSFAATSSGQAAAAAQAMGVKDPTTDPKCLKCHAPLFDKAAELKAEGVTCEVCHGPGSAYRTLSVMKDKAAAVKNGLKLYGSPDAIKTQCMGCHENPHGKKFDFASYWEKVKHPVPGK